MTAVVVTFSEPLNPVLASNLADYQLSTLVRGRRPHLVPIGISSASYNGQTNAVTLTLIRPLARGGLNLTIAAGSVVAQNGAALTSTFSTPVS